MTQNEKERMFLDLNGVLVKFWVEKGRPDKEIKIELLERMLGWYKKMGYITLDKQEEKKLLDGMEEAAWQYAEQEIKTWDSNEPNERKEIHDDFIVGAKWDRAKMMERAVEGEVIGYDDGTGKFISILEDLPDNSPYKVGDKVKVIVIKEEK